MILQNILSIFVLSLCLATLFITLVTYFLYRVKQLLKFNQKSNNQILEGVFFKKYASHIKIQQKEETNEFDNKLSDRKTLTRFFAIISGIIFLSLLAGYLFSYFRMGEKTLDSGHYEKLISRGLLKEYQLNNNLDNPDFSEFISERKKSNLTSIYSEFETKKIGLFKNEKAQEFDKNQNLIYEVWASYFKRNNIEFKSINNLSNTKDFDIVIVPQAFSLSKKLKDEVEETLLSGVGVLATGPIAYLDGLGTVNHDHFSERIFGVEFKNNLDKKNTFPTAFEGNSLPLLNVAPGMVLNYYPTDSRFVALAKRGVASIYESNTQGQFKNYLNTKDKIVRSIYANVLKSRVAWLALDPPNLGKTSTTDSYYIELLMAKSMLWTMKMPIATLSAWKDGANSVFVPSIDIEDDSEYGYNYTEMFEDFNFPITIFFASDQIQDNQKLIEEETKNPGYFSFIKNADSFFEQHVVEFATIGESNSLIQGNSLQYQFQNIQSSRILLEESTQNAVMGFKPPQLKFDNTTLNAVIQNKMTYMIGNQSLFRFAPTLIDEGNLVYFPKSNLKEETMYRTTKFHNANLLLKALTDRFEEIEKVKGAAFYNFPTKSITAKNLESAVSQFLKYLKGKDVWKTNYLELAKWWREKENINVKVSYTPSLTLEIQNLNDYEVKNVNINYDAYNGEFDFLRKVSNIEIKYNKSNNLKTIVVKSILKNTTLKFVNEIGDK